MLCSNSISKISGSNARGLAQDFMEDSVSINLVAQNLKQNLRHPTPNRNKSKSQTKRSIREIKNQKFLVKDKHFLEMKEENSYYKRKDYNHRSKKSEKQSNKRVSHQQNKWRNLEMKNCPDESDLLTSSEDKISDGSQKIRSQVFKAEKHYKNNKYYPEQGYPQQKRRIDKGRSKSANRNDLGPARKSYNQQNSRDGVSRNLKSRTKSRYKKANNPEINFIQKNKMLIERIKRKKEDLINRKGSKYGNFGKPSRPNLTKKSQRDRSMKKYGHVKSKIDMNGQRNNVYQNQDRNISQKRRTERQVKGRSRSANFRPTNEDSFDGSRDPYELAEKTRSNNQRQFDNLQRRDKDDYANMQINKSGYNQKNKSRSRTPQKSISKHKKIRLKKMEEEYERKMEKFKTKNRKQKRRVLQGEYEDHATQPRYKQSQNDHQNLRDVSPKKRYASPINNGYFEALFGYL